MLLRVAAVALVIAGLSAGCSKRAPAGFGPGLGQDDEDDESSAGILTTGIDPTGGEAEEDEGGDADPSAGEASGSSDDPSAATSAGDDSSTSSPVTTTDPMDSDASSSSGEALPPGDPLDPSLDVPEDGEPCTTPGSLVECPGIAVCRFQTTEQGMCESCDECGNLGAVCSEGTDCDILFACYEGRCTNFCQLGTYECGPIDDCLDVGHATYGVCDPAAL